MAVRKVSIRTRFEVFKRDGFRCLYCGATPVMRPLHVDHVIALANGGSNSPANLVTACRDCNLGKSAVPLERKPLATPIATDADRDHSRQIMEYLAIQRQVEAARSEVVEVVAKRWEEVVGPLSQNMYNHLVTVLKQWPIEKIEEAMQITARKMGSLGEEFNGYTATSQAKYFHGILRKWREADE
jgi:hypothetical protein